MFRSIISLTTIFFYFPDPGIGQSDPEGKLPRGKPTRTNMRLVLPKAKKPRKQPFYCSDILASRIPALGFFDKKNRFYYLAKNKRKGNNLTRGYYVIQIDSVSGNVEKMTSLMLKTPGVLISTKFPVNSLSILPLPSEDIPCLSGKSKLISIFFDGEQHRKNNPQSGTYRIVESHQTRFLADLNSNTLRAYDLATMQDRRVAQFKKGEVPIFYSGVGGKLYTINSAQPPMVIRYKLPALIPEVKVRLKNGFRLIRHREQFGVIGRRQDKSGLTMVELAGWLGKKNVKYTVPEPRGMDFEIMSIIVSFQEKILFFYDRQKASRGNRKFVYLIDYATRQLIEQVKAPANHYVDKVALSPDESIAMFIFKDIADDILTGISIFSTKDRKWKRVHLQP